MNEPTLYGSLCLSDIPKELIKKGSNGKMYLNIYVNPKKPDNIKETIDQFGKKHIETHYVKCAVKKENQVEGVNYYIGNLETLNAQPSSSVTATDVENAPIASQDDIEDLPF